MAALDSKKRGLELLATAATIKAKEDESKKFKIKHYKNNTEVVDSLIHSMEGDIEKYKTHIAAEKRKLQELPDGPRDPQEIQDKEFHILDTEDNVERLKAIIESLEKIPDDKKEEINKTTKHIELANLLKGIYGNNIFSYTDDGDIDNNIVQRIVRGKFGQDGWDKITKLITRTKRTKDLFPSGKTKKRRKKRRRRRKSKHLVKRQSKSRRKSRRKK